MHMHCPCTYTAPASVPHCSVLHVTFLKSGLGTAADCANNEEM